MRGRSGKFEKIGVFHCDYCKTEVERTVRDGTRNRSCGCMQHKFNVTHGQTRGTNGHSPLFKVWGGMKARCYSYKNSAYHRYGGRGIRICDIWLNDPAKFFDWAQSLGWSRGLEVDRIDNNGPYSPDNCRLVPHSVNSRNRRSSKLTQEIANEMRNVYACGGITKKELGDRYGVTDATAGKIINFKIWVPEVA